MRFLYHEEVDPIQHIVDLRKSGRYAEALSVALSNSSATLDAIEMIDLSGTGVGDDGAAAISRLLTDEPAPVSTRCGLPQRDGAGLVHPA